MLLSVAAIDVVINAELEPDAGVLTPITVPTAAVSRFIATDENVWSTSKTNGG